MHAHASCTQPAAYGLVGQGIGAERVQKSREPQLHPHEGNGFLSQPRQAAGTRVRSREKPGRTPTQIMYCSLSLHRHCPSSTLQSRRPKLNGLACVRALYSHARLYATPWTVARQAPLSPGFSRQEYWSGSPCPPPGDLPDQGSNSRLLHLLHWRQILYPPSHLGSPFMLIREV